MRCPGSLALESTCDNVSSSFADEGNAAHTLAALTLNSKHRKALEFLGEDLGNDYTATEEMCAYVQEYVETVLDYAQHGDLFIERRVSYAEYTGVPKDENGNEDSFGTSDAVILTPDEIIVIDLKYGRGVIVHAEENEQLMLYALGALYEFGLIGDFKRVRMVIHQPRLEHLSEWDCSVEELLEFGAKARLAAGWAVQFSTTSLNDEFFDPIRLAPGEKQCRFCRAKATCPALSKLVMEETAADFDDITKEVSPEILNLVEAWIKSKRAEIESRLFSGEKLTYWKLVEGRRGSRKWSDEKEAEIILKSMRLKVEQMYDLSVISPTTAEKLLKDTPKRWKRLEGIISRSEGKPSVCPTDDKRPALSITAASDDFAVLEDTTTGEESLV